MLLPRICGSLAPIPASHRGFCTRVQSSILSIVSRGAEPALLGHALLLTPQPHLLTAPSRLRCRSGWARQNADCRSPSGGRRRFRGIRTASSRSRSHREGMPAPATHPSSSHPVMITSADTPATSASLSTLTAHIRGAFGGRVDWRLQEFPLQTPDIAGCHRTAERPLTAKAPLRIPVSALRDGDRAIRKRILQLEQDAHMLPAIHVPRSAVVIGRSAPPLARRPAGRVSRLRVVGPLERSSGPRELLSRHPVPGT